MKTLLLLLALIGGLLIIDQVFANEWHIATTVLAKGGEKNHRFVVVQDDFEIFVLPANNDSWQAYNVDEFIVVVEHQGYFTKTTYHRTLP